MPNTLNGFSGFLNIYLKPENSMWEAGSTLVHFSIMNGEITIDKLEKLGKTEATIFIDLVIPLRPLVSSLRNHMH